ncbi:MAG: 6-carboxytetrahydropterin synthase [Bacteroidales bacterium]|nr:6-carboxytetrahydropterin synthase [Bacteroidales bacterium]
MIYVTRRERFNAAHRLFRPDYSDTKNLEIFGKCSNPNWHGHNYTLYVTVKGEVNPETGFLMNLKDLSELVNRLVIEKLDHKNINLEVDFLSGVLASAENIAIGIWGELEKPIAELGSVLHKIQLYETENNFVEYYGNSLDNIRG